MDYYCWLWVLSHVRLFASPWTVAHQLPLSMEFSMQEYWSGLPFPIAGDLPDPGIKPVSLASPALAGRFLTKCTTWEAQDYRLSVQFSPSVVSHPLQPHGLQYAELPCPSPVPGTCSNSCPLSRWCHPPISSSVVPFSSCLQSFTVSGSSSRSHFFSLGGQSIAVSASVLALQMNIQDWSLLGWIGGIALQSKGLSRIFSNTTVQKHQFLSAQLSL